MVTMVPERVRLIRLLQAELRRKCVQLSTDTVEMVIDAYDRRLEKLRSASVIQR